MYLILQCLNVDNNSSCFSCNGCSSNTTLFIFNFLLNGIMSLGLKLSLKSIINLEFFDVWFTVLTISNTLFLLALTFINSG